MDPNDILVLLVGGAGGIGVIGAGAWAYLRSRGKTPTDPKDQRRDPQDSSTGSRPTGTAVKERPAAPTWADTLSAPSRPADQKPAQQKPGEAAPAGEEQAHGAPEDKPVRRAPETDGDRQAPAATAVPTDDTATGPADAPTAPAPSDQAPAPSVQAPAPSPEAPAPTEEAPPAPTEETTTEAAPGPVIDTPEAPADRMLRLRERLARSGSIGRGILTLLTRGAVDEDTWDEIEETLLLADLGPDATDELMENLRRRIQVLGTDDAAAVREVLREELVTLVNPDLDRRLAATVRTAPDETEVPSVILMVGVNGTGKTTTVGKLARVLVAAERTVVLGAADTFRAAAADQLATWGSRVGVDTVRADRDGADPAAVAFDAVKEGVAQGVDVVIIDTAGRLQNKKGLMDQLGKVRRVAEKGLHGDTVAEVLLVIDATTGQNGMQQARVFSEAVNITGIVLTKLDGTAKGGIVVNVQRELGVPVKMVGLGEGMDDLTPFDAYGFVDALLGD